jgi:hypothetical protein
MVESLTGSFTLLLLRCHERQRSSCVLLEFLSYGDGGTKRLGMKGSQIFRCGKDGVAFRARARSEYRTVPPGGIYLFRFGEVTCRDRFSRFAQG